MDCQGVYTQTITLSEALIVLPNPIENGDLQVFIPGKERAEVQIRLFSLDGSSVLSKRLTVIGGVVQFNMDAFARGVYLLNVMLEDQMYSYKIIKR